MAQMQHILPGSSNQQQTKVDKVPLSDEHVQMWISQLEQLTDVFYNQASAQNTLLWQEAQSKLVQFQKLHDPYELCTEIIKKSRNNLVLYQATMCLKNAVANGYKGFVMNDMFELFQFLYEFLCSQALENEMSVNETTALICAMIVKRIVSETFKPVNSVAIIAAMVSRQNIEPGPKSVEKISYIIYSLCSNVKDPNENLSKRFASAMMLSFLIQECHLSSRSVNLGIHFFRFLNARKLIESHLKHITESCLETINWAFTSNLLNPMNQTRETQILFHLVGTLIQCVENALSFNTSDTGVLSSNNQVLRVLQTRTINMLLQPSELDNRTKSVREWYEFIMSQTVVQFLFNLYSTIRSMINCVPGWDWPSRLYVNCLNCLCHLSEVSFSTDVNKQDLYQFIGNLMLGAVKIMDDQVQGIDDSYQIASVISSISMHTSEARDTISRINADCHLIPFLQSAQRFTCKVFAQVASTSKIEEEDEEEKTVDTLLDFWSYILKNIDTEIKWLASLNKSTGLKLSSEDVKAYSRVVVENYISGHIHKPLGQLERKADAEDKEVDLDQADEQEDNNIHAQQLLSFGNIARFDTLHTAKLLIELMSTRVGQYEALLHQFIGTKDSPDDLPEWELINDDLHWLLLMLQHFLTQTGYGEVGFICNEILSGSVSFNADVQKTLQAFDKLDYSSTEADPIVRLILLTLKICQIEMGICQSGKVSWLSAQTNSTLTSLLSRFCLTYLYPKESEYTIISENMNYCFGQDAPTADKFTKFVIEHGCCIILYMKSDPHVVNKNVLLLTQLLSSCREAKKLINESEEGGIIKTFMSQLKPQCLSGFSPKVAKAIIKLATRIYGEDDEWDTLIDFFMSKWSDIMSCCNNTQQHSELISNKFPEFCDFAIGVCEACGEVESELLFRKLLLPIVKALPIVLETFGSHDSIVISVFDLLYHIVKLPLINISTWENDDAKAFYEYCNAIVDSYTQIAIARTSRGPNEEDCEDIVALLNFSHEVMKRDWGNSCAACDSVVRFSMERMSAIVKPEYLTFPKIRSLFYRLLVYLVDEEDRLTGLNDTLLSTISSSVMLALTSKFDKDIDNHAYTIISIVCRAIYLEKGTPTSERLSGFIMPILPALFDSTFKQGSFSINSESADMISPALFALKSCFPNLYHSLVNDLVEKIDDQVAQLKVRTLFTDLESNTSKFVLNRSSCREFTRLFIPFLAEVHNYITIK